VYKDIGFVKLQTLKVTFYFPKFSGVSTEK
jgi:hypothetical protein